MTSTYPGHPLHKIFFQWNTECSESIMQRDLTSVPMEVNIFHYSPGTWMRPHVDLKDKILTHVFFILMKNGMMRDGGCLSILKINNPMMYLDEYLQ